MTCLEKIKADGLESDVLSRFKLGHIVCPTDYGYTKWHSRRACCFAMNCECTKCWEQQAEKEKEE